VQHDCGRVIGRSCFRFILSFASSVIYIYIYISLSLYSTLTITLIYIKFSITLSYLGTWCNSTKYLFLHLLTNYFPLFPFFCFSLLCLGPMINSAQLCKEGTSLSRGKAHAKALCLKEALLKPQHKPHITYYRYSVSL